MKYNAPTVRLSPHFTLEELTHSDTADARSIDNYPDGVITENLKILAAGLEQIRALLGDVPIRLNSAYRCEELNTAIRGSKTSAHMRGLAADFTCSQFGSPYEIVKAIITSEIRFDQCIQEGTWVHVSFDPRMRQETLTAHFDANGNATYTRGA